MVWVKLDDHFPDHPKVVAAGALAAWLHVCGLAYCNRNLTDGFIPSGVAARLTDYGGALEPSGDDIVNCVALADVLVEHGIWESVEGGFRIHDFLDFQPSKNQVEAERIGARERMRSLRQSRSHEHQAKFGRSSGTPYPYPVPENKS